MNDKKLELYNSEYSGCKFGTKLGCITGFQQIKIHNGEIWIKKLKQVIPPLIIFHAYYSYIPLLPPTTIYLVTAGTLQECESKL